ncbi:hypothetical protein AMTRI_Chr04g184480 [Amborella trichopoda]
MVERQEYLSWWACRDFFFHQLGRERGASFVLGLGLILLSQCGRERRGRTSFTSGLWVLLSPQENDSLEHFCGAWSDGWWISLLDERCNFANPKNVRL